MRTQAGDGDFSVRVIAGTHVVTLGFDVSEAARADLLGFAIERAVDGGPAKVLSNYVFFEHNAAPGKPKSTLRNPVQAFLWNDYGVRPGQELSYRAWALYGSADDPQAGRELRWEIATEPADDGRQAVYFNRGIAGSQAYADHFENRNPLGDREAERWLSRGLREAALDFIAKAARPGWRLRGALYELAHIPILEAIKRAGAASGDVELVVALPHTADGAPKHPTDMNEPAMTAVGLRDEVTVIPRTHARIAHNKFLVLMEGDELRGLWTGSTNLTDSGLLGHSNVGHVLWAHDDASTEIVRRYLRYFEELKTDPRLAPLRAFCEAESPLPAPGANAALTHVFSPRQSLDALDLYAELMTEAEHSVFFTAPFGLDERLETLLTKNLTVARYGLLDDPESAKDFDILQADDESQLVAGAYIGEGDWGRFLAEEPSELTSWAKYIHTKYMIVDPLSETPLTVSGSANFSIASTDKNDENMLMISGDKRVADIYLTEFMRLFTHFRFRARVGRRKEGRVPLPSSPNVETDKFLTENASWTDDYFKPGNYKRTERELFRAQL